MEYSPPPLFKQGASARAKVVIFSFIAIALLIVDFRLNALSRVRQVVGTALYPLQRAALMPRDALFAVGGYFSSLTRLESENRQLKNEQVANAQAMQQARQLAAENAQLRRLLNASERLPVPSLMSEILYDARDPFTRKIVMDRGTRHGVTLGQPVIDDAGVVGQVTRVFPFTSEVTLLTDKDQAIPVQVVRSGLRSVAYGRGQSGVLDLRFMPVNADIQKGDVLVTSGIDGVYPAGLSVAKVMQVEHKSSDAFARIVCQPAAGIDRNKQLLILLTPTERPPRPPVEEVKDKKTPKKAAFLAKENTKEAKEAKDAAAKQAAQEPVKTEAANTAAPKPAVKESGAAAPGAAVPAAPTAPPKGGAVTPPAASPAPKKDAAAAAANQAAAAPKAAPAAPAKPSEAKP